MVVPALLYLCLNRTPALRHGWAIPTATDIAFATGVLTLLGRRVPAPLRAFLLAIAVIDDIGAIILIAIVYSTRLDPVGLSVVAIASAALYVLLGLPARFLVDRLILGVLAWIGLLKAGAHPALAGIILGLLLPREVVGPIEQRLHGWVAFGVMPLYALANAGVRIEGVASSLHTAAPLALGVVLGLIVGKPVGITLASLVSVRAGWSELPPGVDLKGVWVAGCIAGMGFTMSIFISHLAFRDELLATAKLAVVVASAVAALVGLLVGRSFLHASPTGIGAP
jgi:Na+:H+ antiporter, NhaA family